MRLEGHIEICEPGHIAGWARDLDAPHAPLRLAVHAGRLPLGSCLADQCRADLDSAGIGPHGFVFTPPHPLTPAERDCLNIRTEAGDLALFDAYGGAQPNPFLLPPPPRPARARFRRCILHIGTEKTGTTSLQRSLALNREALMAQGVFVPASLAPPDPEGAINHSDLAALALADWRLDDPLRLARGITDAPSLARFRAQAAAALASECATVPPFCDTILLSSEHCHSRIQLLHEVAALHGFLAPWVERFTVLVYLRPQHELAMSQHAMHLLAGHPDPEFLPELPYPDTHPHPRLTDPIYFDYDRLLARWSAIFGRDALHPAIYSAADLREGDIVADVLDRIAVNPQGFVAPPRLAGNIAAPAQVFLRDLLAIVQGQPEAEWIAGFVTANLRRSAPGPGRLPSRAHAQAFARPFEAGNARVRDGWFPHRPRLFTPQYDALPETETEPALSGPDTLRLIAGLLTAEARRQNPGFG